MQMPRCESARGTLVLLLMQEGARREPEGADSSPAYRDGVKAIFHAILWHYCQVHSTTRVLLSTRPISDNRLDIVLALWVISKQAIHMKLMSKPRQVLHSGDHKGCP